MNTFERAEMMLNQTFPWRFFRAGGFDQVRLETVQELLALPQLDQKLWVALACPVSGLEFDEATLRLIDADADGYVRAPELLAAIVWAAERLSQPDVLVAGLGGVPLAAIRTEDALGQSMARVAREVLQRQPDAPDCVRVEWAMAAHAQQAQLALQAWQSAQAQALLPGVDTPAAYAAWLAVRDKLQDWFVRVNLAGFDARATEVLNAPLADLSALYPEGLQPERSGIAALPLAQVRAGLTALSLDLGINPAWVQRVQALRTCVLAPLLGSSTSISPAQFQQIEQALTPYKNWLAAEPDAKAADEAVLALERLARYVRDLHALANNFVALRAFYARSGWATFQAGTLYLDARSCELCLWVNDAARHAAQAAQSGLCLAYLDCTRGRERRALVAAFTAGDSEGLAVGRNGVFYDRQGRDWNATVTRLVLAPISLREAFWSPYKKVSHLLAEQLQKLAAAKAQASDAQLGAVASAAAQGQPLAKPAQSAFDVAKFAGIFAAIGLAVGALGSALAAMAAGFFALKAWQMPLAVLGVMALISGPAMLLAWFKLRTRQLGPLLDANGWAVNSRARINIAFGTSLTQLAQLPPGAERSLSDPYADPRHSAWRWALLVVVGAAVLIWRRAGLGA